MIQLGIGETAGEDNRGNPKESVAKQSRDNLVKAYQHLQVRKIGSQGVGMQGRHLQYMVNSLHDGILPNHELLTVPGKCLNMPPADHFSGTVSFA